MNTNNIDFRGITPLNVIKESSYSDFTLFSDTNYFFVKRKNPSIKFIKNFAINYSSLNSELNTVKNHQILNLECSKDFSIDFINSDNKKSSLIKSYPLMINCILPLDLFDYKLYLPFANIYNVEKRIIRVDLTFMICYSTKKSVESKTTEDEKSSDFLVDSMNNIKEIVDIDEEFM